MGKQSKANKKKDQEKKEQKESSWEEQIPMKEFFAATESGGTVRPVKTTELVQVNHRTFEKDYLEQAKE